MPDKFGVLIDRHFAGSISPQEEQRMRAHLSGCADCRRHYANHQLLAELDPSGLSAEERIGRGLGFNTRRPREAGRFPQFALAFAACAALVVIGIRGVSSMSPETPAAAPAPAHSAFAARGIPAASSDDIVAYRVRADGHTERLGGHLSAGDGLAFAYKTGARGETRLLLFAVDELDNVYWYFPAWTDAQRNPRAMALPGAPELSELPEAVMHRFKGTHLELHAIFTDQPVSVRDVEGWIARQPQANVPPFPQRTHLRWRIEVDR